MYPEELVAPMRAELVDEGFRDLKTATEVDDLLKSQKGTVLIVVNSVCGCAAGSARPAAIMATRAMDKKPDVIATVFAGVDNEAVQKVREHALPYPPSSPSILLFKDGVVAHVVERLHIEGRTAEVISNHLVEVMKELG